MWGETTITVRGVDMGTWKEFQKALIDMYGTVYGTLGPELTKAIRERLEKIKADTESSDIKPIEKESLRKLIYGAMVALGGEGTISEVHAYLVQKYGIFDHDVSTAMGDLSINGAPSSRYKEEYKFLERISRGKYRLIKKNSK